MNRELVNALARLLVADMRRTASDPVSGVAPTGDARSIVGKLHAPVDSSGAASRAVVDDRRAVGAVSGAHGRADEVSPSRTSAGIAAPIPAAAPRLSERRRDDRLSALPDMDLARPRGGARARAVRV